MSDLCLTLPRERKSKMRFKHTKNTRLHFMRAREYRMGRRLASDSGFLSSLDQQHCLSHKYHKSQAGRIFKDRPVSTVWQSLSFAAQNVTTSLLFLCSEYSRKKPAVAEGAQSIPSVLLPSGGNRWRAAGCTLLLLEGRQI